MQDQTMTESEFIAKLDSIIRSDNTESESLMPLQDNDNEDSESETSGKFNEEPELPPRQIRRNESKKLDTHWPHLVVRLTLHDLPATNRGNQTQLGQGSLSRTKEQSAL